VLHGDSHIGNCYLLPDGTGGLLDWQLMRIASWANDVAYTVMTALDVDQRRKGEQELLRLYLDELGGLGVDPPSWDDAWDLYRKQMVWGVVAWLVTPTAMYDEPLLDSLIRRCVTAADDLGTYDLLGA
jgi:aminoglycoside phosphotransferase (APT) family kinase protein